MNALKDTEICDKMQVVTKTVIKTAYDDMHFKVVRYVILKNENNLPVLPTKWLPRKLARNL